MNPEKRAAALALIGKMVRFAHQPDRLVNYYRVTAVVGDMVELDGWAGQFAPHLFVAMPPRRYAEGE